MLCRRCCKRARTVWLIGDFSASSICAICGKGLRLVSHTNASRTKSCMVLTRSMANTNNVQGDKPCGTTLDRHVQTLAAAWSASLSKITIWRSSCIKGTQGTIIRRRTKKVLGLVPLNPIVWCYVCYYVWHYVWLNVVINKVSLLLSKIMVIWIFGHYHIVHEIHSMWFIWFSHRRYRSQVLCKLIILVRSRWWNWAFHLRTL